MPVDGLPLTHRIRFEFHKGPTARRVRESDKRLRRSPQTSLALHADGERLERPEQRQIAGRSASHHSKSTARRTTGQSFG